MSLFQEVILSSILLYFVSINAQCSRYNECDDCVEDDDDVNFQKCEWNKDEDYCYNWFDEPNNENVATSVAGCNTARCSSYDECEICIKEDDVVAQKCEWNKDEDYCYNWYDEPNENENIATSVAECTTSVSEPAVMPTIFIVIVAVVAIGLIYVVYKKISTHTTPLTPQTIPPRVVQPMQMQPQAAQHGEMLPAYSDVVYVAQPLTNDDNAVTQNDTYATDQGNGAKHNYVPVAPSAPGELYEEDASINEGIEGVANVANDDRYSEIKQWFNSAVNLKANNEEYFRIFIEFGYDDMSLIKEITETELDQMGIKKMAHKKRILSAIQAIIL